MAPSARNPSTWDEYEGRASPSGSFNSNAITEDRALLDDTGDDEPHPFPGRRRSSVTNRLAAMADIGGVNSFRSFARSWQRAAGFAEVIPRRPSFILSHDASAIDNPSTEDIQYTRNNFGDRPTPPQAGLLRQHLENSPPSDNRRASASATSAGGTGEPSASFSSTGARDDGFRERESKQLLDPEVAASGALLSGSPSSRSSIFANPPLLATGSIIGSYGSYRSSLYGTIGSVSHRPPRLSIGRGEDVGAAPGVGEDSEAEEDAAHGEHEPILVKEVKQGNKVVLTVEGQSTLPQSVFNSINAIIGVGILSLPLAIKLSGWIIGLVLLTLTATVTAYTGGLLARCMDYDPSLITYSDLAYVSFGTQARIVVSALFSLELVAANVALMILFADSLYLLLPGVATVVVWKCVCAVLVLALNAVPLRLLSYTSVIGILSTFCIVLIVVVDGLVKEHTPGSLWEPATTYLLPSNWLAVPLAYGLLASPWGAHSIFPSIYRDMRHPAKWGKTVKITFSFSYVLDTCLAVIGILMFGDGISDAITSDILATKGFPQTLTIMMCVFVAIIPLTKMPLNARPLVTTAEVLLGLHDISNHHHNGHTNGHHHHHPVASRRSALLRNVARASIRVVNVLVLLLISILFPAFDSVCAFLGAALCTLVSIVLPLSFYLKLFWTDISTREKLLAWTLLIVFSIFGLVGTVWTFLPKHLIGE